MGVWSVLGNQMGRGAMRRLQATVCMLGGVEPLQLGRNLNSSALKERKSDIPNQTDR